MGGDGEDGDDGEGEEGCYQEAFKALHGVDAIDTIGESKIANRPSAKKVLRGTRVQTFPVSSEATQKQKTHREIIGKRKDCFILAASIGSSKTDESRTVGYGDIPSYGPVLL